MATKKKAKTTKKKGPGKKAKATKTATKKAAKSKTKTKAKAKKATAKKTTTKKVAAKATKKAAPKKATKKIAAKKATAKKTTAKRASVAATKTTAKTKTTQKRATTISATLTTNSSRVAVGEKVPSFSLPATGGKTVSLESLKAHQTVLYFYPKDDTPGCTIEGKDFTRLNGDFSKENTTVYGISRDDLKSHEKFKEDQCYSIELISDTEEELCKIFGVIKDKNMYGKKVRGIERSTFLIGKDGTLLKEWRGVQVPNHAQEVLDYVKGLATGAVKTTTPKTTSSTKTTTILS